MLTTITSLIIGAVVAAVITVKFALCKGIWDIYIPILLFAGFSVLAAAVLIILLFILTLFVNKNKPVDKPSRFWMFIYNHFLDFILLWSGIKVKVDEKQSLGDGSYLFVFNHRSNFDPMIVSKIYRKYFPLMVSKPQNFDIPIAGAAIHKVGFLRIPREDDRAALKVILKAIDYLKQGYSVGICPEGTRNKHKRSLLPFRSGCFKIAMKANRPIAVVCLEGTENIAKNFPFKRTKITVSLLKVITPEEYRGKHTQEVSEVIHNLMMESIVSYKPLEEKDMIN